MDPKIRIQRIAVIKGLFVQAHEKDQTLDEKSFVARLCMKWGASPRIVRDYLNVLEDARFISRDPNDGLVWLNAPALKAKSKPKPKKAKRKHGKRK